MLLTLVGVSLSSLMVPIVLGQITSTRTDIRRSHALDAAQTGLDVALGQIRAANDGTGTGVLARLPCGPFTGRVGVGGTARYQVTIDYLGIDPQGQSDAWVTANRMSCTAGSGTASTPAFALLRSQGTDEAVGAFGTVPSRSLRATYPLRLKNKNVTGGLIRVYKTANSNDLCLDAGSGAPPAGTNVQMQRCSSGSVRQNFAYQPNLTLLLVASRTPAVPLGMCLDAGTPHALARVVQLLPCGAATVPQQQWIFNDSANFEGTADGRTADGFCFNVQTRNSPGSFVILGSVVRATCRGAYDNIETFSPEAGVGTGAAGAAAKQLLNLNQFSRCLMVTQQNVNFAYLIASPCQQLTDPATVTWDQQWTLPAIPVGSTSATGPVTTTAPLGLHCLRSPGSIAAGQYVTVALCPPGPTPATMRWTVYADTGTYATSYRIQDSAGYCLSVTDPAAVPPDLHPIGQQISKMVLATCSGSAAQKWNAPGQLLQSLPLKDIGET